MLMDNQKMESPSSMVPKVAEQTSRLRSCTLFQNLQKWHWGIPFLVVHQHQFFLSFGVGHGIFGEAGCCPAICCHVWLSRCAGHHSPGPHVLPHPLSKPPPGMQESSELRDSSQVDSRGTGASSESSEQSFSDGEASQTEWSSDDSVEQYSTDISDTRLWGGLGHSDSEGFSTDVSDTRRKRPRAGGWGKSRSNA